MSAGFCKLIFAQVAAVVGLLCFPTAGSCADDGLLEFGATSDISTPVQNGQYQVSAPPAVTADVVFQTGSLNGFNLTNKDTTSGHTFPYRWWFEFTYNEIAGGGSESLVQRKENTGYSNTVNWAAGPGGTLFIGVSLGGTRSLLADSWAAYLFSQFTSTSGDIGTGSNEQVEFEVLSNDV